MSPVTYAFREDRFQAAYQLTLQSVIQNREGAASAPLRRLAGEARTALKGMHKK